MPSSPAIAVPSTTGVDPSREMRKVTVSPGNAIPVIVTVWPGLAHGTLMVRSDGVYSSQLQPLPWPPLP